MRSYTAVAATQGTYRNRKAILFVPEAFDTQGPCLDELTAISVNLIIFVDIFVTARIH